MLIIGVLLAYIVGSIGIRIYRNFSTPAWQRQLGTPIVMPLQEDGKFSIDWQKSTNFINSDILFAPNWNADTTSQLLTYISIPPIHDDEVTNTDQFDINLLEIWLLRDAALSAIAERFNANAPIEEIQKQILADLLSDGMYQDTSPRHFNTSVANIMRAGLADRPGQIRDQIFNIYEHPSEFFGPHGEMAAANIKRQLTARGTFEIEGDD
jgi:hypothetical protein